ncbi:MAG TPA: hypothetical protein VM425_20040 [Myxococcota bacterium]|nr:hypothetical protein [Myxococcota bacterium]
MKRLLMLLILLPILSLVGCNKEESGQPDEKAAAPAATPAAATATAPAAKLVMDQLKLKAAKGWEGEFNKAMTSWTYEKYVPAGDGTNNLGGRFYVDKWDSDMPSSAQAYAEKLKTKQGFQDMGYIWTKAEPKDIQGGWLVMGECIDKTDKEAKSERAFVANIGGCSCRGSGFKNDVLRDEAIAACQSIKP